MVPKIGLGIGRNRSRTTYRILWPNCRGKLVSLKIRYNNTAIGLSSRQQLPPARSFVRTTRPNLSLCTQRASVQLSTCSPRWTGHADTTKRNQSRLRPFARGRLVCSAESCECVRFSGMHVERFVGPRISAIGRSIPGGQQKNTFPCYSGSRGS